ncbi:MAG: hypothetical protein KJP19_06880 [Deltaproteobacteria bacterium]|nr:hypothetical protein [Deltaproteobacteria bacterium]
MINRLLNRAVSVAISSIILIAVGLVLWFFLRKSQIVLQDILFWVGAAPILLFSIGLFGNFLGRGNSSYQISRSVSQESSNQRAVKDHHDREESLRSELKWIMAGLLTWLISYVLYLLT